MMGVPMHVPVDVLDPGLIREDVAAVDFPEGCSTTSSVAKTADELDWSVEGFARTMASEVAPSMVKNTPSEGMYLE
jgi:hypothetical protein